MFATKNQKLRTNRDPKIVLQFSYSFNTYCLIIWGSGTKGTFYKVLKFHRDHRVILDLSAIEYPSNLNMIPFTFPIKHRMGLMLFKCLNNLAPDCLREIFTPITRVHTRITRKLITEKLLYVKSFKIDCSLLYLSLHIHSDVNNYLTEF